MDRCRKNQANSWCCVRIFLHPLSCSSFTQSSRYAMRVSPSLANRLIETAKGLLLKFLPDVYIYVDHQKGQNAGL